MNMMNMMYKMVAALFRLFQSFEITFGVNQQSRFWMVIHIGDREGATVTPPALQSENALRTPV